MNPSDLESKVRISAGPASPGGRTEMTATLEVKATACLDPYVLACSPAIDLRGLVEKKLRECVVHEVRGDLEAENQRLRAAVKKWAESAMTQYGYLRTSPKGMQELEEMLKEDLR